MTLEIPQQIFLVGIPKSKRYFDIAMSLVILIVSSPFIILIIITLFIEYSFLHDSRGSIFYTETRYSEGKPFIFYKFRIFKKSAIKKARNGNGVVHTKDLEHTAGSTTFTGKILKKIYMDELPQLWNVLKGDMTLVGPRPTNTDNMKRLLKEKQYAKFLMKAGITGYFQSHKGLELNRNQEEIDMQYINFVQKSSGWKIILYDIRILLITIKTIFRAEGI